MFVLLLSCQLLTAGPSGSGFRSVGLSTLSKTPCKAANALSRCSASAFFFVFDFTGRLTPNLQTHIFAGCSVVCASRYALRCESTTAGHCSNLACLARCHMYVPHAQLFLVLRGLLGFVQVVSFATWSLLVITLGCPVALCSSSDSTKLLLASTPYCVIASNTSSVA